METMTAGTVSILHLDTNLPQSHHHHQICTRPMGFEHQSTLQSSHPVISINEHHRINQSETKILKNRFISDSSEIGNFEKNSYLWNMIDAIYKNPAEVNFQLENVHQLFASQIENSHLLFRSCYFRPAGIFFRNPETEISEIQKAKTNLTTRDLNLSQVDFEFTANRFISNFVRRWESTWSKIKKERCLQDLNLRGETPLDFKSNALTTRPKQLISRLFIVIYKLFIITFVVFDEKNHSEDHFSPWIHSTLLLAKFCKGYTV